MNIRALALGSIVGFLVAFLPACGQTKCGPQNCDGCCDSKGTCVKKPNNNNNTTCGSAGNACTDCAAAGSTCNPTSSTCGTAGGTGGGTGGGTATGGGGGGTCDGCTISGAAGTTCVPLSRTSVVNCGSAGAACRACNMGELCTNGACVVPDAGVAAIGSACNADTDCAGIAITARDTQYGIRPYCKKNSVDVTTANGVGFAYTGGYCTKRCGFEETATTSSCGTGNDCAFYLGDLGEAENACFKVCTGDADCRADYYCLPTSNTSGLCLPQTTLTTLPDGGLTLNSVDAGPGFPAEAGAACADDTACQPPADGICLEESLDAGYIGGACTAECTAALVGSWCGTGGVCNPQGFLSNDNKGPIVRWFCERGCGTQSDGGIVGTCRSGYVCDDPASAFGYCVPNCTNSGVTCPTGQTCNATTGLCG